NRFKSCSFHAIPQSSASFELRLLTHFFLPVFRFPVAYGDSHISYYPFISLPDFVSARQVIMNTETGGLSFYWKANDGSTAFTFYMALVRFDQRPLNPDISVYLMRSYLRVGLTDASMQGYGAGSALNAKDRKAPNNPEDAAQCKVSVTPTSPIEHIQVQQL